MIVVGHHAAVHMHAETVGERIETAGVFSCDDVGALQQCNEACGCVGSIADRRGRKNHRTARNADAVHQRIERTGGGNPTAVIRPVREFGWLLY